MDFSPFALEIETEETNFLKTARRLGVKIVAYSPLGRGFLTGIIKSRVDFPHNLKLFEDIVSFAEEKGCTPSQLALAWILAQGDDFIPIPGTKTIKYLEENAGAVDVIFSEEDEKRIRKAVDAVG